MARDILGGFGPDTPKPPRISLAIGNLLGNVTTGYGFGGVGLRFKLIRSASNRQRLLDFLRLAGQIGLTLFFLRELGLDRRDLFSDRHNR